jgi:hypothetical protein
MRGPNDSRASERACARRAERKAGQLLAYYRTTSTTAYVMRNATQTSGVGYAPGLGRRVGCLHDPFFCGRLSVTAEEKKPANAIRVLEATYGGNCTGVAKGNVTKFIASACDGTDLCNYRVY